MPEHLFMSILYDKQSIGYKVLSKLSLDMIKLSTDYEAQIKDASNLIKAFRTEGHEVKTYIVFRSSNDQHNHAGE